MADTVSVEQVNSTEAVETQERTFTQAELDEIVKSRIGKERAKYSDYEALKEKASRFDDIENANKSELQKMTERAEALQAQLDNMNKAAELQTIRTKVSTETGVPASLLTAETEEACKAQAEAILAFAKPAGYPSVKDSGEVGRTSLSTRDQFADFFKTSLNR